MPWLGFVLVGCRTLVAPDSDVQTEDSRPADSEIFDSETGDTEETASGASVLLPENLAFPYQSVESGGDTLSFVVQNTGDTETLLDWSVDSAAFVLVDPPDHLPAGTAQEVELSWVGLEEQGIEQAKLRLLWDGGESQVPVWAVAGDDELPDLEWEEFGAFGEQAWPELPHAPFPDTSAAWTDSTVLVFLPEDFRDRGAQDVVLHFHGHGSTVATTVLSHRYREQLWASGQNAILIVPQGPVNASSGNFGKLMDPGGVKALIDEVFIALYREGRIDHPVLGELFVTAHSGGYQAAAAAMEEGGYPVRQVGLFDALYAQEDVFRQFVAEGGRLRSNYTSGGGTVDNNEGLLYDLESDGSQVATRVSRAALIDDAPVIAFVNASHTNATESEQIYAEQLRWGLPFSRTSPRIEVRKALPIENGIHLRWWSPKNADLEEFRVQRRVGETWNTVGTTQDDHVDLPSEEPGEFRVVGVVEGALGLPSDSVFVGATADVLVVNGFDRLNGSFGGLQHDFSARVARGLNAAFASPEAVSTGEVTLADFEVVFWLVGDEGSLDVPFHEDEVELLLEAMDLGTRVVVSGSEVGYVGSATSLLQAFGAQYATDDANSTSAIGTGSLANLGSVDFGNGPYPEEYPDTFTSTGGEVLLSYGTGGAAAIGREETGIIVGFPLELLGDADRAEVVAALLEFLGE